MASRHRYDCKPLHLPGRAHAKEPLRASIGQADRGGRLAGFGADLRSKGQAVLPPDRKPPTSHDDRVAASVELNLGVVRFELRGRGPRQLDPALVAARKLSFFAYGLGEVQGWQVTDRPATHGGVLDALREPLSQLTGTVLGLG